MLEATKKQNSENPLLERTIAESDFLSWAYSRFFVTGNEKLFRDCYAYYFDTKVAVLNLRKKISRTETNKKLDLLQAERIKQQNQSKYISSLTKDGDLCGTAKLSKEIISKAHEILSSDSAGTASVADSEVEDLKVHLLAELAAMRDHLLNEDAGSVFKEDADSVSRLINSIDSDNYEEALSAEKIDIIRKIISRNKSNPLISARLRVFIQVVDSIPLLDLSAQLQSVKKAGELTEDKKQKLKAKLTKIELDLKPNTVDMSYFFFVGLVYTMVFAMIFFESFGVSVLISIMLGVMPALVATFIAITISKIKNHIDSNKLFNVLLFICIFSMFVFIVLDLLLLGLTYKLILSLVATIIAYNALNIVEIIIKNLLPGIVFVALSFIKDLVRELSLILCFGLIFDLCFKLDSKHNKISIPELSFIKNCASSLIMFEVFLSVAVAQSNIVCIWLAPIIGSSLIYNVLFLILFCFVCYQETSSHTPITLPHWHTKFVEAVAKSFDSIYNVIERHIDKSVTIADDIFFAYSRNIPEIITSKSGYALRILKAVIDLIFLPIFAVLYPICKAAQNLGRNMENVVSSHPIIVATFFVATAVLCAAFASPIQLYLFGSIIMAGSPAMNIMFGAISGFVHTLFGANVYVATNEYVAPCLASAITASCKTFSSLYDGMKSCCFGKSDKPAAAL